MALQDTARAVDPSGEVPFGIDELFYSRTDRRGLILAGNVVFQRVSGFDWPQLIGAPHRLVRHPATPRAVFRILWATIQKGEPAVAYVCNRAVDGRPYWVLATVLPFGDGFLSVRIKPTSPLLQTVKALYASLVAAEASGDHSIDASVAVLLKALQGLGFASYQAFMRAAISAEYDARAIAVQRPTQTGPTKTGPEGVHRLREALAEVIAGQDAMLGDFERMRILPTNLRILASRLEPEGGPLSAISDIYLSISAAIFAQLRDFSLGEGSLCKRMSERFENAVFLMVCAQLQDEVAQTAPPQGIAGSGIDCVAETLHLQALAQSCDALAVQALDQAVALADDITTASADLRRTMLSLETVTVMGRVESARLGDEGARITAAINQLHSLNATISAALSRISAMASVINADMRRIREGHVTLQAAPTRAVA